MNEAVSNLLRKKITPTEYAERLREINLSVQERFAEKLQDIRELFEKYKISLNTPGSDGRLEKGSAIASPAEFIIFSPYKLQGQDKSFVKQKIHKLCEREHLFEFKALDGTEPLYRYFSSRVQPARVLDARPLLDLFKFRNTALRLWCEQVKRAARKDIVSKADALRRDALNVCKTGKRLRQRERVHFDIDTVESKKRVTLYYAPDEFRISVKPGPLRLVQNVILLKIIKYVRSGDNLKRSIGLLHEYPFNTLERLDYLFENKIFTAERSVIDDVKEHYAFMLRLYHLSEYLYEIKYSSELGPEGVALDYRTSEEFSKRLSELLNISRELIK